MPHPSPWESCAALIDSVMVPIWLTLRRRPLQAFFSIAVLMRAGLVTVRSSAQQGTRKCLCLHSTTVKRAHLRRSGSARSW